MDSQKPKHFPATKTTRRTLNSQIGDRIRGAREHAGDNQLVLARAIGYSSAATIHAMESGGKMIAVADLIAIACFYTRTVRSFLPRGSAR